MGRGIELVPRFHGLACPTHEGVKHTRGGKDLMKSINSNLIGDIESLLAVGSCNSRGGERLKDNLASMVDLEDSCRSTS